LKVYTIAGPENAAIESELRRAKFRVTLEAKFKGEWRTVIRREIKTVPARIVTLASNPFARIKQRKI
jgi:hypothetical protein